MKKIVKNKKQSKKILEYTAVFTKAPEGGYDVSFPGLPGCVTFGKNLKDAQKYAKEVLELWLEVLLEESTVIVKKQKQGITSIIKVDINCSQSCRN